MSQRNEATERQVQAALPGASTWLSANAGSGKTRVLTDRVARLLLDGVRPDHILCLTYTKAAASEMQNRLFKRLRAWAMKPGHELKHELADLGVEGPFPTERLDRARTLFAQAIETPGGLKIQTIHSFCARLLRRFPLEAGVSPQFTEMEDRAAELLRAEVVEDMALGAEAALVRDLARHLTDEDVERLTSEILGAADAFSGPLDPEALETALGLPPGFDADALRAQVLLGGEDALLAEVVPALLGSSTNDAKAGRALAPLLGRPLELNDLEVLEGVFLSGAKTKAPFAAKLGSLPVKALRNSASFGPLLPRLEALMLRVETARPLRLGLANRDRTLALHRFARAFLPRYRSAKEARGWLDFNDLIVKARDLLTDPRVAQWVLYRIDGGFDHILVDEAQDTSPLQWQIIELLAQEFTAGDGSRADTARTIFVVGDKKQSIYSFQGADPREFDRMRAAFAERVTAVEAPFQNLTLDFSFRSSAAILRLVDATFASSAASGFPQDAQHRAFHEALPGRVDLWPLVEKQKDTEEERLWYDPVDRRSATHHERRLAQAVAAEIKRILERGTPLPRAGAAPRPVRAGDFLILVQSRLGIFDEMIRACKEAGLPIAGADRLKVGAELAVRDLASLLRFLALPEDDLALAEVLKSPLGGWDEQALYDLAQGRAERYLWRALVARAEDWPETVAMLMDLRAEADFLRPYDLIERMLTRHDGRRKLLTRLGREAEDGINALLSQALAYEQIAVPSLTGFLRWMEDGDLEIKRQMDGAEDQIRVMTVHGSKGLEAPIVILPETHQRPIKARGIFLESAAGPLWRPTADKLTPLMEEALEGQKQAERAERERLLYVAMTRAENWLIVAAAGTLGKDGESWHDRVRVGLEHCHADRLETPVGSGLRLSHGDWPIAAEQSTIERVERGALPDWIARPAPSAPMPAPSVSPSELGGAKALPDAAGLDEATAKARGTRVHLLLEHLSVAVPESWDDMAATLLTGADDLPELLAEARAVLQSPALAEVFATDALREVPITADLPALGGRRIHGIIDRLIVTSGRVLAVDFKSNARVPVTPEDAPEGLLRQMGAYAAALAQIFPGHTVETALLWTRSAALMPLPAALTEAALRRASLDAPGAHS